MLRAIFLILLFCVSVNITFATDRVLVLRPSSGHFAQVSLGISDGLEDEVELIDVEVTGPESDEEITELLQQGDVRSLVLMDNLGVKAYYRYQQNHPKASYPPAIVVATLFAHRVVDQIENSTAILYEIPAVTSLVDLRKVVKKPIRKVGVIYRKPLTETFTQQQDYCKLEDIELVGVRVDSDPSVRQLKRAIKKIMKKEVDALWVMNDGDLLNKELIVKGWIPQLKRFKRPTVVGIKSLINTNFNFGDYAVYPDHYELGHQTAGIIFDLMDEEWVLNDSFTPAQPISIFKNMNLTLLERKGLAVRKEYFLEFVELIRQ